MSRLFTRLQDLQITRLFRLLNDRLIICCEVDSDEPLILALWEIIREMKRILEIENIHLKDIRLIGYCGSRTATINGFVWQIPLTTNGLFRQLKYFWREHYGGPLRTIGNILSLIIFLTSLLYQLWNCFIKINVMSLIDISAVARINTFINLITFLYIGHKMIPESLMRSRRQS